MKPVRKSWNGVLKAIAKRKKAAKNEPTTQSPIAMLEFISWITSSSSTAGIEARIQTGALSAVGWSVLFAVFDCIDDTKKPASLFPVI